MDWYIGIDLGTSALKGLLVDGAGRIAGEASAEYSVSYPRPGWSEQNPADWVEAMERVLAELSAGRREDIKGISFGGQMHGLVALDGEGRVIRPCILWNDGRTEQQVAYLNETVGRKRLSACTGNIAFAGFTAPKLLWLRENEPENFTRIRRIMLPKDYLVYRLTGQCSTDYSDASGTLLLDVAHRRWSDEMCGRCGVEPGWLPPLHESWEVVGRTLPEYGLPNAMVAAGAGDNAAAAIGMGTVEHGSCNISLGTSGTVFLAQDRFSVDGRNALHSFAHANGKWHLMGCILSAASCRRWWLEDILGTGDYASDEAAGAADSGGVMFLPYLMGERSPHNDTAVRGAFVGLSASTTRAQMGRAVMEGVAFAIRDCLEAARQTGIAPNAATLCGGGARSGVWRQIVADVLNIPIHIPETEQGPAYGAALLAMRGCGKNAADNLNVGRMKETVHPERARAEEYEGRYPMFRQLYPLLRKAAL